MEKEIKKFLPGTMSTITSVMIGYPIDTIKTRMQTSMYPSFSNCIIESYKKEGIQSFYRGITMPLTTLVLKRSIQFRIYEEMNKRIESEKLKPWISGFTASLISPLSNPMHVIKIKMQDSKKNEYKNIKECIKGIYKENGIKGFTNGITVNLIKDISFGTIYLGSYGTLKREIEKSGKYSEEMNGFIAGGLAGSITWSILMPLDYTKTAYQSGRGKKYVIEQCKTKGMKVLWKGGIPTIARIFPINAISMYVYEKMKKIIN